MGSIHKHVRSANSTGRCTVYKEYINMYVCCTERTRRCTLYGVHMNMYAAHNVQYMTIHAVRSYINMYAVRSIHKHVCCPGILKYACCAERTWRYKASILQYLKEMPFATQETLPRRPLLSSHCRPSCRNGIIYCLQTNYSKSVDIKTSPLLADEHKESIHVQRDFSRHEAVTWSIPSMYKLCHASLWRIYVSVI